MRLAFGREAEASVAERVTEPRLWELQEYQNPDRGMALHRRWFIQVAADGDEILFGIACSLIDTQIVAK